MSRVRRSSLALLAALPLALAAGPARAATTLIAQGATWRYLDNGTNQGTAWIGSGFNDAAWKSGPAQLGYGDGDEATLVLYGPNSSAKYTTTYFRKSFSVTGAAGFARADLRLLRDDGAVVYLNNTEIFRSNMPAGAISSATFASTAIGGTGESTWYTASVDPALLVEGANLLAVEIHQSDLTSSDISFDLSLTASTSTASVTRGPYLQMAAPDSTTVRWRTDSATDGRVRYGTTAGNLNLSASGGTTTEHVVSVSGLAADTTYYYSVGTATETLAGGDATYSFRTSPLPGTAKPTRIWVLGDSGTANASARAVRDAYVAYTGSRGQELWLMLGDNAYNDGTDAEFQAAVFDTYPAQLRNTPLWPTLGNHDGHTADSATETGPYYSIFTLPRQGEIGGVASSTEAYYSFDYANIHFVCLDSYETSRLPGGAMLTWLEDDLLATDADWTIAFWHHPPYSKGSHDSDVDVEMVQMRTNVLPILEAYGVDLVLTGHSHSYERSVLLDQHYGTSSTLQSWMIVDGGDGDPAGDGAYVKPSAGPAAHEGAVYAVAGSGGQVSSGALNHPVMVVSLAKLGSMVLDVDGPRLDARFVNSTGGVDDAFVLVKGPTCLPDGTCGDCLTSADCDDPAAPACDPGSHTCRACNADAECGADDPSFAACLPDGTCGECSAANSSACVGSEPFCLIASAECVQCLDSSDCPSAAPVCSGAHVCEVCVSDVQCAAIDPALPACLPGGACGECSATNSTACAEPEPHCLVGSAECVECLDSSDCAATTPVCGGSNACEGCSADEQCAAIDPLFPACQPGGACAECSLSNQSQCTGETPLCDLTTGSCIGLEVFSDGFESHDTSAWSSEFP